MAKHKEEKTNVMRVLDQKKIPYTAHTYDPESGIDGVSVARSLGQDPASVFKTLVARGASGGYYEPVGLALRGETQQAALSKLPAELTAYRRWLGLPPVPAVGVVTQEAASPLNVHDADSDILLPSEHRPLTAEEYEARKALALRSAEDFLTLYRSIPDKTHTTLPQRETFYGDVPLTAEEMYRHTKNVNAYYFGEIGVEVGNEPDILICRRAGFAALERQPRYLHNAVFHGSYDEDWTLRKVLRRFVWHDRIHGRAMWRMACALCGSRRVADPYRFA